MEHKHLYIFIFLFIVSGLFSVVFAGLTDNPKTTAECGPNGDCLTLTEDCQEKCGCERFFIYNETTDECVLDREYFNLVMYENNNSQDYDIINNEGIAITEKLRKELEDRAFRGILIAAILVVSCASICVVSICIFCCHIRYSDHKLKKDLKALAKKLKIEYPPKTPGASSALKAKPLNPIAESCNVVVEDANVLCV